jgi:hypothetical protein
MARSVSLFDSPATILEVIANDSVVSWPNADMEDDVIAVQSWFEVDLASANVIDDSPN